jgi:dTMP kinase
VGTQIRAILSRRLVGAGGEAWDKRSLALLFAADRLDHLASEVEPRLAAGIHVVCDRYVLSSLAYQSLDCPRGWVEELNRLAAPPDRTFFLDLSPKVALGRRMEASGGRAELFETLPQQRRIAANYRREAWDLQELHRVVTIDGSRSAEEVGERIWEQVRPLLR